MLSIFGILMYLKSQKPTASVTGCTGFRINNHALLYSYIVSFQIRPAKTHMQAINKDRKKTSIHLKF